VFRLTYWSSRHLQPRLDRDDALDHHRSHSRDIVSLLETFTIDIRRVARKFDHLWGMIEIVITNPLRAAEHNSHPPVTPCELPDGIQLVYTDDRGHRRVTALDEGSTIDFGRTRPFREPPAYRGQRNFPGWWWSVTTKSHIIYESWLERHHVIEADRDARVTGIAGQPFALTWSSGKKLVKHIPDLLCRTFDGGSIVTDCRPVRKADTDSRSKYAVTAAACREAGWEFRLVGEPDPVWAASLRWLAGYRHPRFADPGLEELLMSAFTQQRPLAEAARQVGDPIRVLPVLFHLLWLGRLTGDLSRPLGIGTVLTASSDPLEAT
jgi:hypothetical protein